MHGFASFNRLLLPVAESLFSAISPAILYGKGIFTTIAIYEGKSFLWEKHWQRLTANAAKVGIDISEFSEEATRNALNEIIEKNSVANGRARITFFDESAGGIWSFDTGPKTSLLITTADNRKTPGNFRLTVSPYRLNSLSPLSGVKSCNYLNNLLAFEEAKRRGFDEAIFLSEGGEVASATMANVFWLKDGRLYTPGLRTGCLPGTTREYILENLECDEVERTSDVLNSADDIFLTSAGIGIVQIADFEDKKLQNEHHPILDLLPARN